MHEKKSLQDHQCYNGSQGRQRQFYTFQDHSSPKEPNSPASKTIRCSTLAIPPSITKSILCHPEVQSPPVTSPHSVSQVRDIMVLKRAFPDSFDTIGNMPSTYTIRTDPSVPQVQHARQKVPNRLQGSDRKGLGWAWS